MRRGEATRVLGPPNGSAARRWVGLRDALRRLRRPAQRAGRQRVRRLPAVHRHRRPLRRRDAAAAGGVLLRAGAGGAQPRDDDAPLPARRRRRRDRPRRRRADDAPSPTSSTPVALALEQERRVTGQINELAALARQEGDYTSEQFMQWFIKEQIEEVATMSDLLRVVERARDNPLLAEEYLAREGVRRRAGGPHGSARGGRRAVGSAPCRTPAACPAPATTSATASPSSRGRRGAIGRAVCLSLAEAGAIVVAADVDEDGGRRTAQEAGGHFVACDVTRPRGQPRRRRLRDGDRRAAGSRASQRRRHHRLRHRRGLRPRPLPPRRRRQPRRRRARGARRDAGPARLGRRRHRRDLVAGRPDRTPWDPVYSATKHGVVGLVRSLGPVPGGAGRTLQRRLPRLCRVGHDRRHPRGDRGPGPRAAQAPRTSPTRCSTPS